MGSYSRMLWKATNYNSLRREQENLKQQYVALQTQVQDTNERLSSLQSLAAKSPWRTASRDSAAQLSA